MPAPPYYRFFVGDYVRDASHLSLLEHGAYRRLIDLYMIEGGSLAFDMPKLYRLLHATSKEEQAAVQVVVEEFFRMDGNRLRHKRCDRELAWQRATSKNQSNRAKKRWENPRQNMDVNATALPHESRGNAIQNQNQNQNQIKEKEQDPAAGKPLDATSELWSFGVAVLTRDGKKPLTDAAARSFIGSLRKTWSDDTVLEAMRAAIGTDDPKAYARAVLRDKLKIGEVDPDGHWD